MNYGVEYIGVDLMLLYIFLFEYIWKLFSIAELQSSIANMMGSSSDSLIVFQSDGLISLTDNFNEKNLIGFTQFGKLYRGKINPGFICAQGRNVTVKIWDEEADCITFLDHHDQFLMVKVCSIIFLFSLNFFFFFMSSISILIFFSN